MPENKSIFLIILAVFLLIGCLASAYFTGKKAGFAKGYETCTQEFSTDGGKMYPDAWKK